MQVCVHVSIHKSGQRGLFGRGGVVGGGERQKKEGKNQSISLKENRVHSYLHFI